MNNEPGGSLRKVQEFLNITFETMGQGITIYDSDLRLVAWNDRYSGLGVTPLHHLHYGASLLDLYVEIASAGVLGPGDPMVVAQQHIDSIRTGPLIHSAVLSPPTGRSILIRRFRLQDGGICATFDDVTDKLRAESELRQTQKMDAIGKLTGGVAHDFNNLLTVIQGNLELALERGLDPGTAELLRSALEGAERGAKLTHRLLAFARRQPLSPAITDLGSLMDGLMDMLQKMLGESIEVELIRSEDLWLCNIDRGQFENVILNLAVNARDSMPSGGKLTLRASNETLDAASSTNPERESGEYVCVAAVDSGSGMGEATVERAFEPFFTTKPAGQGTGLGLSMAHGFVMQSGGQIQIDSVLGEGTTVRIYLPRAGERAEGAATKGGPGHGVKSGSGTVVVVEDDDDLRPLVVRQLKSLGYEAQSARDSDGGLRLLRELGGVDVLLTDVILSGRMNGCQLADAARALIPGLPVLYMSGYSENTMAQHGIADPAAERLQKPFRRDELAAALHECRKRAGAPGPAATD